MFLSRIIQPLLPMDVSPLSPNASQSDYLAGRLPACTVAASSLFDTIATAAISYIIQVLSPIHRPTSRRGASSGKQEKNRKTEKQKPATNLGRLPHRVPVSPRTPLHSEHICMWQPVYGTPNGGHSEIVQCHVTFDSLSPPPPSGRQAHHRQPREESDGEHLDTSLVCPHGWGPGRNSSHTAGCPATTYVPHPQAHMSVSEGTWIPTSIETHRSPHSTP